MICFICNEDGAEHRLMVKDEIRYIHTKCRDIYLKGPNPGHNED